LDQLKIPYEVDKGLVRGLDYYSRTTFEIQTRKLGAQNAIAGGGRYDGLIKSLGGPDHPAIGFAIGFDRLSEIVGLDQDELIKKSHLFIAALGDQSQDMAFQWQCAFGLEGIRAEIDFSNRSLKSQMKQANRLDAAYVLILGENEIERQIAILRNMATKNQTEIPFDGIINNVRAIVG
jgi:histidyl-tRNA synthetase